jgi:hypothetical protein
MFEMPVVSNVQLAQQGLEHGSLRFRFQGSVPLTMAFALWFGNWQFVRLGHAAARRAPHSVTRTRNLAGLIDDVVGDGFELDYFDTGLHR